MKRIVSVAVFLFTIYCCCISYAIASTRSDEPAMVPKRIVINGNGVDRVLSICGAIHAVGFYFAENVAIEQGAYCSIVCDNDTIGKYAIYMNDKPVNSVFILFEDLKLPKDNTYKIEVPSRFVHSAINPEKQASNMSFEFAVPDKFSAKEINKGDVLALKQASEQTFYYNNETMPFDDARMILYREGKPIMEFPILAEDCKLDFDMGKATSRFGRTLNFEKGVNYTIVMPEGALHHPERDDIVNTEETQKILGAYDKTIQPLVCQNSRCEFNGEELESVAFTFSDSVALTPNAVVQLLDVNGDVVCEKRPSLSVLGNKKEVLATLTADFSGVSVVPNSNYTICLPEATVVSTGSDIRVNSRYAREVSGDDTAVGGVEADGMQAITDVYTLSGVKRNTLTRGVNIVRLGNGKVVKVQILGK